ncbi:ATP-binding cassette domain-containing protein [Acidianus sulfidivorans JP7]|uniref:ABC transporter ATP-binding protein n=2 Tax=Acidianus TaxID=12914 RepID=A0A2U9IQQ2_9CREN|nr:ATP-binding cassette domain-containing protein [Acidianus sulfidivorans JP7]
MPFIFARCIWKTYGKITANEDISFEINSGEFVTFLGPNGGGKTTLMRQIYGELFPDKGEIKIMGLKPQKAIKYIGVVPQEATPMTDLNVEEHIMLLGMLKGLSRNEAKERTKELIEKLRLDGKKRVDDLSGGNKRKVLIASALISNPKLLILDEPTVGLDPEIRRDVWTYLKEWKKNGTTIIMTTHYLDEAEELSDRIYFMNKKILLSGKINDIKEKFSNYYEVMNIETGEKYYVKEENIKDFLSNINFKFEVKLPSLEEIYMKVISQ